MVKKKFDEKKFEERMQNEYEAFQGELQKTNDNKAETFLQVSYFEKSLQDSMEFLLESDRARRVALRIIVGIFNEKGILSDQSMEDAYKIIDIRNLFAHNFNDKSIKKTEKIIFTINLRLSEPSGIEEGAHAHLPSVYDTLEKESKNWNMYQRLDFICRNLIDEMIGKIMLLRDY